MSRTIQKDPTRPYWTARDESGCVLGYVRGEGQAYRCVVGENSIILDDRGDALLWLRLRTDTKEARDAFFA